MGKRPHVRRKQSETCRICGRKLTAQERRESRARYYEEPMGYVAMEEWARAMIKTYVQRECPGCGRFTLWEPK